LSKNSIIKHTDAQADIRINKYLSDKGLCSRREADRLIAQGRVRINGKVAEMGSRVAAGDVVELNGKRISSELETRIYMAFNKPVGITCTTDRSIRGNIVDYINYPQRIFHVGRLDKDSEGLILMTNDGDIVNKILRASNNHEKEYIVTVDRPVTDEFLKGMSSGVPVLGTMTNPCTVERRSKNVFRIILTQGLNRQIRRMCSYFGFKVVRLKRIRIMNIKLGDLPVGKWRYLTETELTELNKLIASSTKTQDAPE
jgi:23S rRNA pseudouridine2604 synthase